MGILSDLDFDGDRCQHCGRLLHKHYGGKHTRRTLREWDGDIVFATMVDIRCGYCGVVNEIFWAADMLPPVSTPQRGRFACVPTTRTQFSCVAAMQVYKAFGKGRNNEV